MISSSRATRKVHSLPPLPLSSRIFGCEQASVTIGTPISFTTGMAPRQAPLCVWPMITSTWSTSTSLRTALTASPGCALLSAKNASSFLPMTPPLALISSTASVAPQRTPSPVMAAGPLIAEAKPMRMGGACAPADDAPAESAASSRVMAISASRIMLSSFLLGAPTSPPNPPTFGPPRRSRGGPRFLRSYHREILAGAGQRSHAGGCDLDGVFDLDAAPAVLVVGRLDAEDHARFERGGGRGVDRRRIVGLEPDAVADMMSLIVRQTVLARDAHGDVEQPADRHAGLHGRDRRALTREDGRVIARLLVAGRAEHRGARDVRAIRTPEAAEVEAHEIPRAQRAVGGVDVGERGAFADRDHREERLSAAAQDFLLVHARRIALGDAGLEHGEDRGDAVLGDERRALEGGDLVRALHHAGLPEHLVRRHERRCRQVLLDALPRGRKQAALIETHAPAEYPEVAEDAGQRVGGARRRRARPLTDLAADLAGIVGGFEEELAVAGEVIHLDAVGGHARRVDERDDERRPAAREDRVELEPAEEGVGNGEEPAQVVHVVSGGGDQRIETLGLEHAGQALSSVCVHALT